MYAHLLCGNRDIFVLPSAVVPRAASGRPEAVADDARDEEVTLVDSTCEAGEQSGAICSGVGGGRRGPRGRRDCKARSERRVGRPCHRRKTAYVKAVNRNKKEKLTALLHHVSVDVLRWAFFNL